MFGGRAIARARPYAQQRGRKSIGLEHRLWRAKPLEAVLQASTVGRVGNGVGLRDMFGLGGRLGGGGSVAHPGRQRASEGILAGRGVMEFHKT